MRVHCSTSEGSADGALVDEGATYEVLIRNARSALAEGRLDEEVVVALAARRALFPCQVLLERPEDHTIASQLVHTEK